MIVICSIVLLFLEMIGGAPTPTINQLNQPIEVIEVCDEFIRNRSIDEQLKFECNNPNALITTMCNAMIMMMSRRNEINSINEVTVQTYTCQTAKFIVSFLERMDNVDVVISTEFMNACYDDRGVEKLNDDDDDDPMSSNIKMVAFILDIIDAFELKTAVIILDSTTSLLARQLQRHLTVRPLKAVVANLDNLNFQLDASLAAWSKSHNFLVFCGRPNQERLIKMANELGLFDDPYMWIFEEGCENNATKAFADVEYVWNVNIARVVSPQKSIRKGKVVIKVDFTNVSEEYLDEYRQSCVTRNFSSWTNWTRSGRSRTAHVRQVSQDDETLVYKLLKMNLKCFGATGIELKTVNTWSSQHMSFEMEPIIAQKFGSLSLRGCHFKVGIVNNSPSVMYKEGADPYTSATGMDVELLKTIADKSEFTYEFVETNDSTVGNLNDAGEWTGLIRLLKDKQIDIIIPTVAITATREEVMDFSATIRDVSAVVVIKKPGNEDEIYSDYIQPFEKKVWFMIALALLISVVALTFTHLYSPYGATMAKRVTHLHSQNLNWWNSFYVLFSSLVQQGADRTPTSISGKIIFASFLLGAMILMQNYSSLLVSFLTVNKPMVPFSTLEELTKCEDYTLGLVDGSSLIEVFSTSNEPIRKRLWEKIKNQGYEKSMLPDLDVALEKVVKEKLALLIRSTAVHDLLLTNCSFHAALKDVIKVSYHVAFRKRFPYVDIISQHISRLRETGFLDKLKNKYSYPINSLPGRNICKNDKLSAITMGHVSFLLCILAAGFVLTLMFFVVELLVHELRCGYSERAALKKDPYQARRKHSKHIKAVLSDVYRYVNKVERTY